MVGLFFLISALATLALIVTLIFTRVVNKYDKKTATVDLAAWKGGRIAAVVCVVLFSVCALLFCITSVQAGHVGLIDVFGNVSDTLLQPGVSFVSPFANVREMSVKTQEVKEEDMAVPTKEGLTVGLDLSVLCRVNEKQANNLYKTVGVNYIEVVIIPQIRAISRGVTSNYDAKALYTSSRDKLALEIMQEADKALSPRGIIIEAVLLRNVDLPANLSAAITEKLKAEQEAQRMEFVLNKERQEAERKKIEAEGISDFQRIVSQGISDQLLKWKGIEATERLATSTNAKVVVIGGKDGLPLILDSK